MVAFLSKLAAYFCSRELQARITDLAGLTKSNLGDMQMSSVDDERNADGHEACA